MDFSTVFKKKSSTIFDEFATKGFAEAVKQGVTALGVIVFHSTAWGTILGIGVKGIVDALFAKASELENKIDLLLQQPLLTGITLLEQALLHNDDLYVENIGRERLLESAHLSFVNAYSVSSLPEDKLFIYSLDCLTLALSKNHKELVRKLMPRCMRLIKEFEQSAKDFESENEDKIKQAARTYIYLYGGDPNRDKPMSFGAQKAAFKPLIIEVEKIKKTIQEQRRKLEILQDLYNISFQLSSG